MNNEEFLKEMHDYIDHEYRQFNEYQNIVLEVLRRFCLLCEENCIKYTMAYGTMLGAVRDHRQIPWDYDIDVFVPNTERDRLLSSLDTQLEDAYYYVYKTNLAKYPAPCLRICRKGYTYMALHVDVFFLVGCPEDDVLRRKFIREVNNMSKIRMQKYVYAHIPRIKENALKSAYHFFTGLKNLLTSSKRLDRREERLFKAYGFGISTHCMAFTDDPISYPTSWFLEYEYVEFGDLKVRVPKGYDGFLTKKFKKYSEYLPIKNRFMEFLNMKRIVDERQINYEA